CHQKAAGKIKVKLSVSPSSLFDGMQYTPGQVYSFTATLEGEHLGLSSPLANYNSIVVSIVDAKGFSTGSIGGYAAEDFYSGFPSTIASAGQQVGRTSWTFQWTPGPVGSGPVTIYLAAVDGNGAKSGPWPRSRIPSTTTCSSPSSTSKNPRWPAPNRVSPAR